MGGAGRCSQTCTKRDVHACVAHPVAQGQDEGGAEADDAAEAAQAVQYETAMRKSTRTEQVDFQAKADERCGARAGGRAGAA